MLNDGQNVQVTPKKAELDIKFWKQVGEEVWKNLVPVECYKTTKAGFFEDVRNVVFEWKYLIEMWLFDRRTELDERFAKKI